MNFFRYSERFKTSVGGHIFIYLDQVFVSVAEA